MLTMVGYEGLWSFNAYYSLWTPCLATFTGECQFEKLFSWFLDERDASERAREASEQGALPFRLTQVLDHLTLSIFGF